jgi:hypothetical protein
MEEFDLNPAATRAAWDLVIMFLERTGALNKTIEIVKIMAAQDFDTQARMWICFDPLLEDLYKQVPMLRELLLKKMEAVYDYKYPKSQ